MAVIQRHPFTAQGNKAAYTATQVASEWAEAVTRKANQGIGQEQ